MASAPGQSSPSPKRLALTGACLAVTLLAAGCGQSGSRDSMPTGPTAKQSESRTVEVAAGRRPVLSRARIASAGVESGLARYTVTVTVTDPDGDTLGGRFRVRVVSGGRSAEVTITQATTSQEREAAEETTAALTLSPRIEAAILSGTTLTATVGLSPVPTAATRLALSVQDRARNRSAEVRVTAPKPAGAPSGGSGGLTPTEAQRLNDDMGALVAAAMSQLRLAERLRQETEVVSFNGSTSVGCPQGGSVSATVSMTVDTDTLAFRGNGTARLNTCRLGDLVAIGALNFIFSGQCPPSITVTVRGRIQVLKNGVVVDDTFDVSDSASASC